MRRQRKLDQVEIPEDHVLITDELLGKGGFGEVYLADYNNHNAAAKVLSFLETLSWWISDSGVMWSRRRYLASERND